MTKSTLLLIIICFVFIITSCSGDCSKCRGSRTGSFIPLEKVEAIKVNFQGNLYLYQDSTQKASVIGPEIAIRNINTHIENGVWEVSYPKCLTCEDQIEVRIGVPNLKSIELNGTGDIIAEEKIAQSNLSIVNNGPGKIIFKDLQLDSLHAVVNGNGSIELFGAGARSSNITINGLGDINMNQFPSLNLIAEIVGQGNLFGTIINNLHAHIVGNGNIYYKGTPVITEDIIGNGKVINNN